VGPTVLTLPYALRGMGWALGLTLLSVMAAVTFYEYSLMSRVLDHCEARGRRHIRFRELAADVLGKYTPLPSTGNLPDGSIINRRHPLVHPHVLGGCASPATVASMPRIPTLLGSSWPWPSPRA
jgi:hypothetical protein